MSDHPSGLSTAATPVSLLIADGQASVRQGLRALFASTAGIDIIDEAADTDAVLDRVRALTPDVVIMDLSIPPSGGLVAIQQIKTEKPATAVVVLTRYDDPSFVRYAMVAGASGYVLKQSSFRELRSAIEAAVRVEQYVDPRLGATVRRLSCAETGSVSVRERDVLRRTALGHSYKDIAGALDISVRAVERHKAQAMRTLALRDRRDLIRYASRQGWLDEP